MVKDNLTNLLSQLNVESTHNEHSKAEQTCLNLLDGGCSNPGQIFKHCLIAVIKQDKYERALALLQRYKHIDEKYGSQFMLEKLYIYYKLNQVAKFEKLFSSKFKDGIDGILKVKMTSKNRGLLHARAQFCYRNGKYEESYKIYHYLASSNDQEEFDNDLELACNERVPLTALPNLEVSSPLFSKLHDESYDLLFNESMILSAKECYQEAIELLTRALTMAKGDGYESDINAIELQLAYVYQMMGEKDDSKKLLNNLLTKLEPGSAFQLIVKNNINSFIDFSKYSTNFNLLQRNLNFEKLNSLNLQNLTFEQWSTIQRNYMFLQLFNNNKVQSKSTILSRTLSNYSNLVDNVSLETYKTQSKKLYHHCISMINSGTTGSVIGFLLLTLQLLIVEKQWDNSIRLCESFLNKDKSSSKSNHIVKYILFELYKVTGRHNSKRMLLFRTLTTLDLSLIHI